MDEDDDRSIRHLDLEECHDLLRRCTIGRVAVNVGQLGPLVVPVNYVMDRDAVVFRTDEGTKLDVLREGPISFQIDGFDHARHTGWSVLVRGVAYEADEWEIRHLELDTWAGGERSHWVRLVPGVVTGRRIELHGPSVDDRGYR